jgi:hypothetical protein
MASAASMTASMVLVGRRIWRLRGSGGIEDMTHFINPGSNYPAGGSPAH